MSDKQGKLPQENPPSHQFEHLVSSVEDYAIFTLSPEGNIQSWNRGAERIKQYSANEIVGRHFSIFYGEMDLLKKLPEEELEIASREGRFADEGWRVRKDGTQFWASVVITAIHSSTDEPEGFLKITRDLTERRMAAEHLRQSEERFRLLLENVEDYAIFMLDPEGHVMSWNAGAKRIKGFETSEILGRHFSIFYPEESKADHLPSRLIAKALREGKVEDEGWRMRKNGTRFWAQVLLTAIYDQSGELRGYAKITRDLTDRREINDLKELDRKKDAFLATVAHELRNPLAPLLTGLDILHRSSTDETMVRELSATLEAQVRQMARLVDDLLDMSRIKIGKVALRRTPVLLSKLLDEISDAIQPKLLERGHRFILTRPSQNQSVTVDSSRIIQVMTNLLGNSCKFTPEGGEIRLEVSLTNGTDLTLAVTDNGRGIEPEWQAKIFDLYDQVDANQGNGLGIGLTLVKELVELHGGTVEVQSDGLDRGTTFTVLLPDVLPPDKNNLRPNAAIPTQTDTPPDHGKFRVLVADDGKNAADVLGMFFKMEGMEVRVVYDGDQAVAAAREFMPNLVLMDLGMPKMSGFDAARILRSEMPHLSIVALSGWGTDEDRLRSTEAGFTDHLVKPASPAELRQMIGRLPVRVDIQTSPSE